jgi:hypothetical protein
MSCYKLIVFAVRIKIGATYSYHCYKIIITLWYVSNAIKCFYDLVNLCSGKNSLSFNYKSTYFNLSDIFQVLLNDNNE